MLDFYDFFTREFGGIVPYLRDIGVTEKEPSQGSRRAS